MEPLKITPPPVSSAPLDTGARWRSVHTTSRVSMLTASTRPYLPSESGRGRTVKLTPVDKKPRPPSVTGVRSIHDSTSGIYIIFVSGLYEAGSQLLAPSAWGQTMCTGIFWLGCNPQIRPPDFRPDNSLFDRTTHMLATIKSGA